eukprot:2849055-Pyramimonas_sp.AAC.1
MAVSHSAARGPLGTLLGFRRCSEPGVLLSPQRCRLRCCPHRRRPSQVVVVFIPALSSSARYSLASLVLLPSSSPLVLP